MIRPGNEAIDKAPLVDEKKKSIQWYMKLLGKEIKENKKIQRPKLPINNIIILNKKLGLQRKNLKKCKKRITVRYRVIKIIKPIAHSVGTNYVRKHANDISCWEDSEAYFSV